jgi:hypothetical protein
VGLDVAVGLGSTGLNTGLSSGLGAAFTATPLFQTSFFPDLIHMNFFPEAVAVAPALVHFDPALTAANDGAPTRDRHRTNAINKRGRFIT